MKALASPTSKDFLWRAEQIARMPAGRTDKLLYDIWFDSFLWVNRRFYAGGAVGMVGNFPDKSEALLSSYAKVVRVQDLERLTLIPQAYVILLEYYEQAYMRHHFFNEFSRHFGKSRTPPEIFVVGRYKGIETPAGHVLTIEPKGDGVEVILASELSQAFRVAGGAVSMPASALSDKAPYLMFGSHIQFTAIG